MITKFYTKPVPLSRQIAEASTKIAGRLLDEQLRIATQDYNRRTGGLQSALSSKPFTVTETLFDVELVFNYPSTIRFLDLRKNAAGKKKRYYTPIHNKPLFGHIYGRGYSLSNLVNMALNTEISNFFRNLQAVSKKIEL